MGKIIATDGAGTTRHFTCGQYAHLGYTLPAPWTMTENTCPIYMDHMRSPYAAFGLDFAGTRLPGDWYTYEAVIASNKVVIPTGVFTLPSNPSNVFVIIRRQEYHPDVPGDVRDFYVNNADNSIDFLPGLGLNTQTAYIRVFK